MKILLFGATGQLGRAFQDLAETDAFPIGWTLLPLNHTDADFSKPESILPKLNELKPDVILSAAAYTQVDQAEKEPALCDLINFKTPAILAQFCKNQKIPLIHFSTDYVYGGQGSAVHLETEKLQPSNEYGRSKAKGDEAIAQSGCDHLIFRTSWVYSHEGKNFVKTMLRLSTEKSELKVVNDQIGAPTYAPDLAVYALDAMMQALEHKTIGKSFPSGVYHLTNSGFTSWCEFAQMILPKTKIIGIPTSEYPTLAKRPLNSRLSLDKFKTTFDIVPRPWQEALKICLNQLRQTS